MEEHNNYAVDFIEATRWIKAEPAARQGQRRRLQHLVQLPRQQPRARSDALGVPLPRHRSRLDMGIVNAGMLEVYEEIEPELLELVEDVLLNRRPDATERLVELRREAEGRERGQRRGAKKEDEEWRKRHGRRAPLARAGQGHRHLHRRRHRGSARQARPAAPGHRRAR